MGKATCSDGSPLKASAQVHPKGLPIECSDVPGMNWSRGSERESHWREAGHRARCLAGGLAISLLLFGSVALASVIAERRKHGSYQGISEARHGNGIWLKGPWPLAAGALGLAGVNIATLTLSGRPWGVTFAFALWGSKIAAALGLNVAAWPYWQTLYKEAYLPT